jgi:hypothetical protein
MGYNPITDSIFSHRVLLRFEVSPVPSAMSADLRSLSECPEPLLLLSCTFGPETTLGGTFFFTTPSNPSRFRLLLFLFGAGPAL